MKHSGVVSVVSELIVALAAALVPLGPAAACPAVDCFIHAIDGLTGIVTAREATGPAFQFAAPLALLPRLKVGQKVWFDPATQVVSVEGAPKSPTSVGQVQPAPGQPPIQVPGMQPNAPLPQGVLNAEQITTSEQFDNLPDNQVIDVKGTRTTAGEIRARMQQASAQAEARMKQAAQGAQAEFEASRMRFEQEQKAMLEAENAKVRAEFQRLRQQQPKLAPQTANAPQPPGRDAQLNDIRQEARASSSTGPGRHLHPSGCRWSSERRSSCSCSNSWA